jgi:hypothetical protein
VLYCILAGIQKETILQDGRSLVVAHDEKESFDVNI